MTRKFLKMAAVCVLVAGLVAGCKLSAAQQKHEALAVKDTWLKWRERTLTDAYHQAGHSDPKWDEAAKGALDEFARLGAGEVEKAQGEEMISNECVTALSEGCDDAMIRYLSLRYCPDKSQTGEEVTDAYCDVAGRMEGTGYPAVRKFYAWMRAGQEVIRTYGRGSNVPPQIYGLGVWPHAETDLLQALDDKTMPAREAYEASVELLDAWRPNKKHYPDLYQSIDSRMGDRAKTAYGLLLKGVGNTDLAWQSRGSGYADTVTTEGEKGFESDLAISADALAQAWSMDPTEPRIALQMMRVELGQGQGRDRMELWFGRVMKLNPNDYDACNQKLNYLEPKWYGSVDDMLAFGRQCVTNEQWGGHVPLILPDAHKIIQTQYTQGAEKETYWRQAEVWSDMKRAYARFFELNPGDTGWYHNYAWYAYQAGDWQTFNEIVPKLGRINYKYFGGKEAFDRMVATAKNGGKPARRKLIEDPKQHEHEVLQIGGSLFPDGVDRGGLQTVGSPTKT